MIKPRLAAHQLRLGYGAVTVLKNINLEIQPGQFIALIGPNGAGKTTLLKALSGELKPQSGCVQLSGRNIASYSPRQRAKQIAQINQNENSAWPFTVFELAAMGRYPHQNWYQTASVSDQAAVTEALERVALSNLRDRPVTELSGGEFQRALLARALAQATPILLLDEPVSNLDLHHQMAMLEMFRELSLSGLSVIASFHDLNLAAAFVDTVILVAKGGLECQGPPAEVLRETVLTSVYGQAIAVRPHPLYPNLPLILPLSKTKQP